MALHFTVRFPSSKSPGFVRARITGQGSHNRERAIPFKGPRSAPKKGRKLHVGNGPVRVSRPSGPDERGTHARARHFPNVDRREARIQGRAGAARSA